MLEALNQIIAFFSAVGHFIYNIVKSLGLFIVALPKFVTFSNMLASYLPAFLVPFFVLLVVIALVKLILSFL